MSECNDTYVATGALAAMMRKSGSFADFLSGRNDRSLQSPQNLVEILRFSTAVSELRCSISAYENLGGLPLADR